MEFYWAFGTSISVNLWDFQHQRKWNYQAFDTTIIGLRNHKGASDFIIIILLWPLVLKPIPLDDHALRPAKDTNFGLLVFTRKKIIYGTSVIRVLCNLSGYQFSPRSNHSCIWIWQYLSFREFYLAFGTDWPRRRNERPNGQGCTEASIPFVVKRREESSVRSK